MLMSLFDLCLPGHLAIMKTIGLERRLSRPMVFVTASCLKVQLECQELWEGMTLVGNRPMLDDQPLVRQNVGPQRNTTAAAVAALVVLSVNFISNEG